MPSAHLVAGLACRVRTWFLHQAGVDDPTALSWAFGGEHSAFAADIQVSTRCLQSTSR
ncbi:MAG: hypothetical protein WBC76_00070 [Actinomycetes bacterium]